MPLQKSITLTKEQEKYVRKNHWAMSRESICKHLGITSGVLSANTRVMNLPTKNTNKTRIPIDVAKKGFFDTTEYLKGLQTI